MDWRSQLVAKLQSFGTSLKWGVTVSFECEVGSNRTRLRQRLPSRKVDRKLSNDGNFNQVRLVSKRAIHVKPAHWKCSNLYSNLCVAGLQVDCQRKILSKDTWTFVVSPIQVTLAQRHLLRLEGRVKLNKYQLLACRPGKKLNVTHFSG